MKKIVSILFLVVVCLFGEDFSYLSKNSANIEQFKSLKQNRGDMNEFEHLQNQVKGLSYEEAKRYVDNNYKPNKFMTRKETYLALDQLYKIKKDVEENARTFLLYFGTKAIPKYSITNTLLELSILQDNNVEIKSKLFFNGIPKDTQQYLIDFKSYLENYPLKYQSKVADNFHLKFGPDFFEMYKINKAPAMAIAYCSSDNPTVKNCNIPYIIRGDTSLITFFKEISKKDQRYEVYRDILLNNMVNYQISDELKLK